jgi:hypothetical protein
MSPSLGTGTDGPAYQLIGVTMPLRHSVLWTLRDTTTPEQQVEMLKGLSFLCMECRDVRTGDYGSDLFGGSQPLRDVRPWQRTPRWRRLEGPPADYDVALHLDFDDWAGHDAYGADPIHAAGSSFNESVSWDEFTARVDWWYEGPTLTRRGSVRHVAMFVWADDATTTARQAALDAVQRLEDAQGVELVSVGHNIGHLTTDFDWILDVRLPDPGVTKALLASEAYAAAMASVAAATKFEWTARLSHVMRGLDRPG